MKPECEFWNPFAEEYADRWKPIEGAELKEIESLANEVVRQSAPVETHIMAVDEAIELPPLYYAHHRMVFERDGMLLADTTVGHDA